MSPKHSSLAYDELKEQGLSYEEVSFEPELNLLVNTRYVSNSFSADSDVVRIEGRITVSF